MKQINFPATLLLEAKNEFGYMQELSFRVNDKKQLYDKLVYIKTYYSNLKDYQIFLVIESKVNDI